MMFAPPPLLLLSVTIDVIVIVMTFHGHLASVARPLRFNTFVSPDTQTVHAARELWATIGPGGRWHPQAFLDRQVRHHVASEDQHGDAEFSVRKRWHATGCVPGVRAPIRHRAYHSDLLAKVSEERC